MHLKYIINNTFTPCFLILNYMRVVRIFLLWRISFSLQWPMMERSKYGMKRLRYSYLAKVIHFFDVADKILFRKFTKSIITYRFYATNFIFNGKTEWNWQTWLKNNLWPLNASKLVTKEILWCLLVLLCWLVPCDVDKSFRKMRIFR